MKEILLALDYNPGAQKTAEMGHMIAKALGAHVTLFHVIVDPAYYYTTEYSPIMGFKGFSATNFQTEIVELKEAARAFLDNAKNHLQDPTIDLVVKEGNAAEMILETAKELNAEMIIFGSHGRKGLEKILVGSVTEKVLHQTNIPLFIIPIRDKE
jgi:nucleotide-binding universal stress UspA family protein